MTFFSDNWLCKQTVYASFACLISLEYVSVCLCTGVSLSVYCVCDALLNITFIMQLHYGYYVRLSVPDTLLKDKRT